MTGRFLYASADGRHRFRLRMRWLRQAQPAVQGKQEFVQDDNHGNLGMTTFTGGSKTASPPRDIRFLFRLSVITTVVLICGCRCREPARPVGRPVVGVKIYETGGELPGLFKEWRSLGINTVFASVSLNRNPEFRKLARRNGIVRYAILPVFFDPEALRADSSLFAVTAAGENAREEWVEFVCPSREDFRRQKIESVKNLIRESDPDGLSIDFIRHFVFWEKVYPDRAVGSLPNTCFDRHCLRAFERDTGIRIPFGLKRTQEISDWILKTHREEWTAWKCGLITGFVKDAADEARRAKPSILINLHAVPWRRGDFGNAIRFVAGQDFAELSKSCDFLSPMTYSHMLGREPAWVHSVVEDIAGQSACPVLPSIQVGKAYLESEITVEEFAENLRQALRFPSKGAVFWNWDALEKEPSKKNVIRNLLKKHETGIQ